MLVLALESSTSSAKALLYDSERGVVASRSRRFDISFCKDGVTGTDEVYRLTMEVGREVAAGRDVAAVALCCVWHSVALCDRSMRPAGGTFAWNYMGASALCKAARADAALSGALYRRTGCVPHVTYIRQTLRYLREQGLDLTDKLLPSQGAYMFYQLTGAYAETPNVLSGAGLLNIETLTPDPFALDYAGIREDQLGAPASYEDAQPLTAQAAAMLGVAPGIPVVPAHADGALNQIASCAARVGRMTLSVGTSGAIRMTTDRPVLPADHALWCYLGVADRMSGAAVSSACNSIDWFRERFLSGAIDFAALDEGGDLPDHPPTFLPFLYGERNPGWRDDRLGGFLDVRPEHTLRDMYRALQAGILFNLYQCYETLTAHVGSPSAIYISGGILHSPRWTQMAADIFGQPMVCVKNADASSVGAALLALHAAGMLPDIRGFSEEIDGAPVVTPRAEATARCRDAYARYLALYAATSAL